jgi:cytochrome c-type biogenesis protein CcmE
MKWQSFALRVVVGSAIGIAFLLTTGFGSLLQTFSIGLAMSFASQAAVFAARRLAGDDEASLAGLTGCVVLAGAAAVIAVMLSSSTTERGPLRYLKVNELVAEPSRHLDRPRKLHGFVEIGMKDRSSFVLHENGQRVRVEFGGPAPTVLQERAEVVATGRLRQQGGELVFIADEVMAKCPDTYQTPQGPRPAAQFR